MAHPCRWLFTVVTWLLACSLWLMGTPAAAQSLESVLRPGDVIAGHAKWEDDCAACHVRFDRQAQDGRCMDCHKDVGADMRKRQGFHGRLDPQACRSCHTDHKGRTARIVSLDTTRFDHTRTDYTLRGLHRDVKCAACHTAGRKWREAPQTCQACHGKDDVHKGTLGNTCADCHTETGWRDTRVDHEKTRFPLRGKHVDARCDNCHKTAAFTDAPQTCVACHRADDQSAKGHQGRFGEKCETCHDASAWKPSRFRHERDTRFELRGAHRQAACTGCHTKPLYSTKTPTACVDCHRADDKHEGSLGKECGACHQEQRWTEVARFDHDRTRYPLRGLHRDARCASCHTTPGHYQVADQRCVACHRQDDRHQPTLGERCDSCHVEAGWKKVDRFDHGKARFALRGAHRDVTCSDCHRDTRYRETPSQCIACHRADDKHEGQLGERCDSCHSETRWTGVRFDHNQARFVLTGRHVGVACSDCHRTPRYRDAPRDCLSCHQADDRHKGTLGAACESCHNTRDWRLWRFEHDRDTRFVLDGAHQPLACSACHRDKAPAGKAIASVGSDCVACHRRDDRHEGAFGSRCEQCHTTTDWRRLHLRAGSTTRLGEGTR
ncbi:MAG: cytochrome C [Burkholderiaceae bacterium]|nr:cytochrome C [Burkholderiaceae bacterium]